MSISPSQLSLLPFLHSGKKKMSRGSTGTKGPSLGGVTSPVCLQCCQGLLMEVMAGTHYRIE